MGAMRMMTVRQHSLLANETVAEARPQHRITPSGS